MHPSLQSGSCLGLLGHVTQVHHAVFLGDRWGGYKSALKQSQRQLTIQAGTRHPVLHDHSLLQEVNVVLTQAAQLS